MDNIAPKCLMECQLNPAYDAACWEWLTSLPDASYYADFSNMYDGCFFE